MLTVSYNLYVLTMNLRILVTQITFPNTTSVKIRVNMTSLCCFVRNWAGHCYRLSGF